MGAASAHDSGHLRGGSVCVSADFAFPDPDDAPAGVDGELIRTVVPHAVPRHLRLPQSSVRAGEFAATVTRAAMPIAAINKHRDVQPRKNDVRSATSGELTVQTEPQASPMERPAKQHLGLCVLAPAPGQLPTLGRRHPPLTHASMVTHPFGRPATSRCGRPRRGRAETSAGAPTFGAEVILKWRGNLSWTMTWTRWAWRSR